MLYNFSLMEKDLLLEKKVDIQEYIDLIVHIGNMICLNDNNNINIYILCNIQVEVYRNINHKG